MVGVLVTTKTGPAVAIKSPRTGKKGLAARVFMVPRQVRELVV
jgi:hypothetical protein